jgi:hypothetical protein
MRDEAVPVEAAYLGRLVGFLDPDNVAVHEEPGPTGGAPLRRMLRARAKAAMRLVGTVAAVARLLPRFVRQARVLNLIHRRKDGKVLALAIASNRLPLNAKAGGVRANLVMLGTAMGQRDRQPIAQKIAAAEHIMLFDPLPVSSYWQHADACRADGVLIVDGGFLLVFLMLSRLGQWLSLSGPSRHSVRDYVRAARALQGSRLRQLLKGLVCLCVASAYADVLRSFIRVDGIFFTFNSKLTELLRAHLITRSDCTSIQEIMHGVGERLGEHYFATLLENGRAFGAYDKHHFIPQIPSLPLFGVFGAQATRDKTLAVNAYLNRYFVEQLGPDGKLDELVRSQYRLIGAEDPSVSAPLIITIFGNYSNDGKQIGSTSFRMEKLLVSLIGEARRSLRSPSILIYVPHPLHPVEIFEPSVFDHQAVVVYPKSIFCWLISDLCLSLVSSAMFEAVHFGAQAFTPLIESDGLFPRSYLQMLRTPDGKSRADLTAALRRFITDADGRPRADIATRARERFKLMRGAVA